MCYYGSVVYILPRFRKTLLDGIDLIKGGQVSICSFLFSISNKNFFICESTPIVEIHLRTYCVPISLHCSIHLPIYLCTDITFEKCTKRRNLLSPFHPTILRLAGADTLRESFWHFRHSAVILCSSAKSGSYFH